MGEPQVPEELFKKKGRISGPANELIPVVMDKAHGKATEWGESTTTGVPALWGHRAIGKPGINF